MTHIGIDLGTSNTLVAYVSPDTGKPTLFEIEGAQMVPSLIAVEEDGRHRLVGHVARHAWADSSYEPANCFRRWKLRMGESATLRQIAARHGQDPLDVTPELLTTWMVEYIVSQVSEGLGGRTIESVLVTVPHGWRRDNPERCRETRLAAGRARIDGKEVRVQEITVSEPVAAAAYWIWEARQRGGPDELDGRSVLVCDMGGGTFDLSLIRVGGKARPLEVIDAGNSNRAGDFADALLCAWMCREFNRAHGTTYPETPEAVLEALEGAGSSWFRRWFLEAQRVKETMSTGLERARAAAPAKVVGVVLTDDQGRSLPNLRLDSATFVSVLEPFYEQGRSLLADFLQRRCAAAPPYAVLFAGGGSRIHGVDEQIVRQTLRDLYSESEATLALERIKPNRTVMDRAIALGAALIAAGVVSVQERLLHDVGIVGEVGASLGVRLGLGDGRQDVLLTPVLKHMEALPCSFHSRSLGLITEIGRGAKFQLRIVVDDDAKDPWVQSWEVPHVGEGRRHGIDWSIHADLDGVLRVEIEGANNKVEVQGRFERQAAGLASLVFGTNGESWLAGMPRVEPAQYAEALRLSSEPKKGGASAAPDESRKGKSGGGKR